VVEILDAAGSPFAAYRYDAWGNPQGAGNLGTGIWSQSTALVNSTLAAAIATRQPLRYAGYCYDSESGLYYLSARHYDPATYQFLSKDPEKADGEGSAYQYCAGEPAGATDPTGTATKNIIDFPWDASSREITRVQWDRYLTNVLWANAGYIWREYLLNCMRYTNKTGAFVATFSKWYGLVRAGGLWDLKLKKTGLPVNTKYIPFPGGPRISREDYGNIHFGYTGRALGLPSWLLKAGSTAAQVMAAIGITKPLADAFIAVVHDVHGDWPQVSRGIGLYPSLGRSDGYNYYTWK
jgi:RHS repeat-associated protein